MKIYNYKDDTRYVTGQRVKQDQVRDAWVKEDVIDKLSNLTSASGILAKEENSSTSLPISSTCFESK